MSKVEFINVYGTIAERSKRSLPDRLMVGLRFLAPSIEVRILVGQQSRARLSRVGHVANRKPLAGGFLFQEI